MKLDPMTIRTKIFWMVLVVYVDGFTTRVLDCLLSHVCVDTSYNVTNVGPPNKSLPLVERDRITTVYAICRGHIDAFMSHVPDCLLSHVCVVVQRSKC